MATDVQQSEAAAADSGSSAPADPWAHLLRLSCQLTVELPLPEFTVEKLLQLAPGVVIDSHWGVGEDVPLRVNGTLLAWSEFEVAGRHLAVRLTELA